jgi:hypothetical protein
MHSAAINPHGNPHVATRGLQQPEPTAPTGPLPPTEEEADNGSFGAAVKVTLSAKAKAHLGAGEDGVGKSKNMNSPAHQARALMSEAAGPNAAFADMPFGKIVSQIARSSYEAAMTMFAPQETPDTTDETVGEGASEPTSALDSTPAPIPPLEDLLVEDGLFGQPADETENPLTA